MSSNKSESEIDYEENNIQDSENNELAEGEGINFY